MITRSFSDWGPPLGVAAFLGFLAVLGLVREPDGPRLKPTFADVSYGPWQRNVLDFYQAPGSSPAPLVVFFHTGAFVSGNKANVDDALVEALNDSGIHFASVDYRYVNGGTVIFPAPQLDGARAVQFLRAKAREWNIDRERIACFGESAGAGIALWIGFHDDLADAASADPVLRESSRILAVGNFGGQPTYDPIKIRKLVGGRAWEHPSLFKNFGVSNSHEALHPSPATRRLYEEGSAITWLTSDDPPVFMVYDEPDGPLPADARPGEGIHHPNFGRLLKTQMDDLGIENTFLNLDGGSPKDAKVIGDLLAFFKRHLGVDGVQNRR